MVFYIPNSTNWDTILLGWSPSITISGDIERAKLHLHRCNMVVFIYIYIIICTPSHKI